MKHMELVETIMKCNRCAACHDVCPTYKISGDEFSVARGRLRLLRMGLENQINLDAEPELERFVNECLLCKACEVNCPSNVPTTQIISDIRARHTAKKGLPLPKRFLYRGFFSNPRRLNLARKLARLYQKSGAQWLIKQAGIMKESNNLMPDMPNFSVRDNLPFVLNEMPEAKHKVAYFLGCSINQFFSNVGIATIKVLQANDCAVIVPELHCCGAPHQSAGDLEEYKRLARYNLDKLSELDVEAIIVDCATCGAILKEYVELFEEETEYREKAVKIKNLLADISSYLLQLGYSHGEKEIACTVTYHDPCHSVRGLKVSDASREILKNIPGISFVEMREADMCCGGAGSYGIFHPDISRKILQRKMNNYQGTGASILVTTCPACMMQLKYGMRTYDISGQVKHLVEILAESYGI
ncbi:MAG: Fe-S oxidoreductase [Peptococcaceae bacterium]|nr:Fe-S oxidoreductase [Peptococcaceae bacterium]